MRKFVDHDAALIRETAKAGIRKNARRVMRALSTGLIYERHLQSLSTAVSLSRLRNDVGEKKEIFANNYYLH